MARIVDGPSPHRTPKVWRSLCAAALAVACVAAVAAAPTPASGASPSRKFSHKSLTPTKRVSVGKSDSSRLARSDRSLLKEHGRKLVPVVVKFDYDALSAYRGSVTGLTATSPSVTKSKLNTKTAAAKAYGRYLVQQEGVALARVKAAVPAAQIGTRLRTVYGGAAMRVPADDIAKLIATKGVVAVQRDTLRKPLTDSSPQFIGAPTIWTALHGQSTAGRNVIFGSLDSGAWPEHPSYRDKGLLPAPPAKADGTPRVCNFGDNPLTPANDPFVCNHKLISGQPFLDTYNEVTPPGEVFPNSARDSNGHGSHTSTTAAGDQVASAKIFDVERGPISGLAPGAHVAIYKVCGLEGCFGSDSVAATGQAIADGVDVINFSISGGGQPTTDPVEIAFLDAYAAGVFVAASAGNSGPAAATSDHLGPWVTTVAASTQQRAFQSTLTLTSGGASLQLVGASITKGIATPTPVVKAAGIPNYDAGCSDPAPAGSFTGKIAVCERGGIGRIQKGVNVKAGGAVGMILYNPEPLDTETDNHFLPTVHLEGPQGAQLLAFLTAHPATTATFTAGVKAVGKGDVMAGFSSRGPGGTFLKPDITAPGVQILAANTPIPDEVGGGAPGQYFQAIAGTSMSSPHIAGSAILLKALHPNWTPGQIKSAIMTTAKTSVVKEDQTTPADPFDDGAGRVNLNRAGDPGLTFDESASRYAQLTADPVHAIDLNVPSVNSPVMPGIVETSRVATNVSGRKLTYHATGVVNGKGASITVSPSRFTLSRGTSIRLRIRIKATTAPAGQYFGQILLNQVGGPRDLHLPVAFNHQQGPLTLSSTCRSDSLLLYRSQNCTIEAQNNNTSAVDVDLHTRVSKPGLVLGNVRGAVKVDAHNAVLTNPALAGKTPGTPAIAPGNPSGGGYLDLASLGAAPIAVGDEDSFDVTLPTKFQYAGDDWDTIALTSDGYAVVGGSDGAPQFEPQNLPDPVPPNNVLAPYWTDTTGDGSPGIYAEILTDDVSGESWFVAQWDVQLVTGSPTQTFQLWIGLNGTEDISYAYDAARPVIDPGPNLGLTVGAENFNGSGGAQITGLPPANLLVTTSGGAPGAKLSYRVNVLGVHPVPSRVVTTLSSPAQQGDAVVVSKINVVRRR